MQNWLSKLLQEFFAKFLQSLLVREGSFSRVTDTGSAAVNLVFFLHTKNFVLYIYRMVHNSLSTKANNFEIYWVAYMIFCFVYDSRKCNKM